MRDRYLTLSKCGWIAPNWPREYGGMPGELEIDGVEVDALSPFYYARPGTIYGGSSEIQRNILAKYVLRLPSQ